MKRELNLQIGIRIRLKREEMKWSREKLAEYIEISPQFLAQIESGRRGMSSITLYKICKALGASADYIVLGKEEENDLSTFLRLLSNLDTTYMPYAEEILKIFVLAINKKE